MPRMRSLPMLACALGLALAGCGEEMEPGKPADMGAGRPGQPATEETPATDVLQKANQPAHEDTTEAGTPGAAGTIRDTTDSGG